MRQDQRAARVLYGRPAARRSTRISHRQGDMRVRQSIRVPAHAVGSPRAIKTASEARALGALPTVHGTTFRSEAAAGLSTYTRESSATSSNNDFRTSAQGSSGCTARRRGIGSDAFCFFQNRIPGPGVLPRARGREVQVLCKVTD
jgi:hypothetical protein